jgi:beta-glucanase (GH16 family)
MTTGVLPDDAAQVCLADAQKQKEGTIFADEFDCASGAKPGGAWRFFDAWGKDKWRDAVYDDKHAKCDGNGNLVLTGEVENGQFRTSYLQTYDWLNPDAPGAGKFGPGKRIEARIDMSQMNCESCWGAFWLFDPTDPYDGNPANGTEIDIVERTVANDWAASRYTVNNHWSKEHGGSVGEWIEGADPSSGFHTYGLDWQANELVWYFDGKEVYRTTQGVSQSNNQAIVLSIENANGGNNPWAPGTKSGGSAKMVVDYVRVSETKP